MGRSQVAFNQRHGRSGQKGGRGRGRGASTAKYIPAQVLGDNSWRYNTESDSNQEQQLDEKVLALESHGNYSNQIKEESSNNEESFLEMSLDIQTLKECLNTLPLYDILRLPPHLTESLETPRPNLIVQNEGEIPNPVTKDKDHRSSLRKEEQEEEKRNGVGDDGANNEGPAKEVEEEDDEEDDMESWLDSVIS